MTEKTIDSSAPGCLILILPIAFLIVFLFATWPVLLALVIGGGALNVWQNYQWQKWSQQVNPVFHELIAENRGSITPMDLAIKANFSGDTAKRYLETKAKEFGAQRRDYDDRGTVYYFITASSLGSIFDDSEPPSQPSLKDKGARSRLSQPGGIAQPDHQVLEPSQTEPASDEQKDTLSLIQSDLAKRLDVHSSTVHKRRDDPDFADWCKSRDPEGIAWKYSPETRLFSPLEEHN